MNIENKAEIDGATAEWRGAQARLSEDRLGTDIRGACTERVFLTQAGLSAFSRVLPEVALHRLKLIVSI